MIKHVVVIINSYI